MKIEDVLVKEDEKVVFKKAYGTIKIPESFFDKKLAVFIGDQIKTFGVFYLDVYEDYNTDESSNNAERFSIQIPTSIILTPKNVREEIDNGERVSILEFMQDDTFMMSTKVIQHVTNVEAAFNLLFNNFIPKSMNYQDICQCIEESSELNGIDLQSKAVVLELIVMQLCRDANKVSEPFRRTLALNPEHSEFLFRVIRLLDAAKYQDAFSALTSSNPMLGTINSIKDTKEGRITEESPVEQSIK